MASDWGTGLYGAPKIAEQMRTIGGFELLMHLGDVYYSGTEDEVQERFLNVWPTTAGKRTVAVNSNHEIYSGGFGYYALALPAIGQKSSYSPSKTRIGSWSCSTRPMSITTWTTSRSPG